LDIKYKVYIFIQKSETMKQTLKHTIEKHEFIFRERSSIRDTKLIHLTTPDGKKVYKFSYDSGNAFEHFKGEVFDGNQMNTVFILTDLGLSRNTSAYLLFTEAEARSRISDLTKRGLEFIKLLY
jgi:hypothetical protein